ncbi:MAG: response regulator transcription factor [Bacteroidales bacterium]|nr:response regulator transcription factor [Bacteroidales bacterium]
MTSNALKIWLVDDHQLFRAGFRTLLSRVPNVAVTFEASNGAEYVEHLNADKPDLVFLDISMPELDGMEAAKITVNQYPDVKIIILSMFGEREYYTRLIDMGVSGFLLKSSDFKEVEMAIEAIRQGDCYFSQELLQQMVLKPGDSKQSVDSEISEREKDVLTEICNGASNQEIAERLFISRRTVEKHRANLLLKTGCPNTASLVVFAVKNGLFEIN